MDDLIDLLVKDGSSSQISDQIKDILFQKSAANIDTYRPVVAASMFGDDVNFDEGSSEEEFDSDVDFTDSEETEEE